MTPFLIVLVVAPAVYWLYRQNARPRTSRQTLDLPPDPAEPIAIETPRIEVPHFEVLESDALGDAEASRRGALDEMENVVELQPSPIEKEEIESDTSDALAPLCALCWKMLEPLNEC